MQAPLLPSFLRGEGHSVRGWFQKRALLAVRMRSYEPTLDPAMESINGQSGFAVRSRMAVSPLDGRSCL